MVSQKMQDKKKSDGISFLESVVSVSMLYLPCVILLIYHGHG